MLREVISNEWFTILIVLCIATLAVAKYIFTRRFHDFISIIGSPKYLKIYAREQKFVDQFDALLFINLIISLSIFSFIAYRTLVGNVVFEITLFLKILIGIGAIILIKVLLERLIASIFEIDALIDNYIFQKTNYKNYIGFLLLPINIILIYSIESSRILIFIIISLLFLVNLMGFFTSLRTNQKLIVGNLFYFILYLCALEIGPYVILYKVLN